MNNKYYSEDINKLNAKYVFIMQSRSMGKTLYEQNLRKAKEPKERIKNEE